MAKARATGDGETKPKTSTKTKVPATKPKARAKAASTATKAKTKTSTPAAEADPIQAMAVADAKANPTRVVADDAADNRAEHAGPVTERGDVFFFYRPDVDADAPTGLADVRRFHVVLRPEDGQRTRIITVGRKTLPNAGQGGGNYWAFVDRVFESTDDVRTYLGAATFETETQGERHLPAARPVGEGVYALARHAEGTILAYVLELPEELGPVQEAFGIEKEGRFVVSLKNPAFGSPAGLGLDDGRKAELSPELAGRFGSRRWLPADPPMFLDHEGLEMVLIGGRLDPDDDLGLELDPQPEDEDNAEVFRDLHIDRTERTLRPLFEGEWA